MKFLLFFLFLFGSSFSQAVDMEDQFFYLVKNRDFSRALSLIEENPSLTQAKIYYGLTAFILAMHYPVYRDLHLSFLSQLIKKGANVKALDNLGQTALHHLTYFSGSPLVIDFLAKRGLDMDQSNTRGMTPLMLAVKSGREKTVESLISYGADPQKQDVRGWTAMDYLKEMPANILEWSPLRVVLKPAPAQNIKNILEKHIKQNSSASSPSSCEQSFKIIK